MAEFKIDFSNRLGPFKQVNGVVNGPRNEAFCMIPDTTPYYIEAGIPFVRLHDTLYPNGPEVDISQVFPDFDADPQDPASYDFRKTDIYLKDIVKTGAEIYYRLGETIEHHSVKMHVFPPQDAAKWAQICVGIARHYNDGWADGFHFNIKNWEIWEEADSPQGQLWQGTPAEYFELYNQTARALKAYDASLLVGGYASCEAYPLPFARAFLAYVKEHGVPLDFFTYDIYTNNPEEIGYRCNYIRKLLDEYGFPEVPVRIAEWNNLGFMPGYNIFEGPADIQTKMNQRLHNHLGASFYTAGMLLMQELPLENAAYYAFNTTSEWSVFNYFGYPYPAYYAFVAYHRLSQCGQRVRAEVAEELNQVYCCAGRNEEGDRGAILLSNFGGDDGSYTISAELPCAQAQYAFKVSLLDETHQLDCVDSGMTCGTFTLKRHLKKYDVLLITFEQ